MKLNVKILILLFSLLHIFLSLIIQYNINEKCIRKKNI